MSLASKSAAIVLLLAATTVSVSAHQSAQLVKFRPGAAAATLKANISGRDDRTYVVTAIAGQTLQTLFSPSNRCCYFNVYEPVPDFHPARL